MLLLLKVGLLRCYESCCCCHRIVSLSIGWVGRRRSSVRCLGWRGCTSSSSSAHDVRHAVFNAFRWDSEGAHPRHFSWNADAQGPRHIRGEQQTVLTVAVGCGTAYCRPWGAGVVSGACCDGNATFRPTCLRSSYSFHRRDGPTILWDVLIYSKQIGGKLHRGHVHQTYFNQSRPCILSVKHRHGLSVAATEPQLDCALLRFLSEGEGVFLARDPINHICDSNTAFGRGETHQRVLENGRLRGLRCDKITDAHAKIKAGHGPSSKRFNTNTLLRPVIQQHTFHSWSWRNAHSHAAPKARWNRRHCSFCVRLCGSNSNKNGRAK